MATTNHYDLIVLGSDIAGLVAAALVARRGKRVLVIPQGPADGTYRLAGRQLPLRVAPVVHMGTPPAQRVWTELGLAQQVRRQHAPLEHPIQFVLPNGRIDLAPDAANLGTEAHRVWPDLEAAEEAWALSMRWADATDEVLGPLLASDQGLVAEGFWSRRFLSRVSDQLPAGDVDDMAPLPAEHGLRRISEAVLPWMQHLTPAQLGKAAGLRLRGLFGRGPEDMPGGEAALRTLLLQRIGLHSGEVKRDLRVAELLIKRNRVTGVSLLGKRDRYGCDHLIVASDPVQLLEGPLVPELLPRALLESLQTVHRAAHRYVLHLEIAAHGLSPALDTMAVCLPAAQPESATHGVGTAYLRVQPGASEDTRLLSLTQIIGDPHDGIASRRESLLDEFDTRGLLPFCHDHIRWMHSPHDGRGVTDGRGRDLPDTPAPALKHPMDALYGVQGQPSLGIGVLPQATGLKCMHFASRLTLPGLGLEGEFAAGALAAGSVASPARSPFSRSPLLSRA